MTKTYRKAAVSKKSTAGQKISVVTGGAGFLGSHLTDYLLARGHRVVAIDNFVTGSVDNISHLGGNPNFKFIQQDVTEFIFLDHAVDYVWHFASPASPIDYLENVKIKRNLRIEEILIEQIGSQCSIRQPA